MLFRKSSTPPSTRKQSRRISTAMSTARHSTHREDTITYTPSEVQSILSQLVLSSELGLSSIRVSGELTNVKVNERRDYVFWDLTDELGKKLKCVVWQYSRTVKNEDLRELLTNGAQVFVRGTLEVESRFGSCYQLKVRHVSLASDEAGAHNREVAQWDAVLTSEGCFDACHKRHIPEYATRVAIVTSTGGSVVHDVTSTWTNDLVPIVYKVYPCAVQGEQCVPSVVAQLQSIANVSHTTSDDEFCPDVIMIVRGGGSREDLWEFNRKELVREVHRLRGECNLPPIISAIGHEPDHTLLDKVVDRAHTTPTDAARALAKSLSTLPQFLEQRQQNLHYRFQQILEQHQARYERLNDRMYHLAPNRTILHTLIRRKERLRSSFEGALQKHHERWQALRYVVETSTPWASLAEHTNLALLRTEDGNDFDIQQLTSGKRGTVVLVTQQGPFTLHFRVGKPVG